jgi:hypothetical protein
MRRVHPALPLIIMSVLAATALVAFAAQQGVSVSFRYFPETRRIVREPLLAYFDRHGGESTFGYPLTDAYTSEDGLLSQTFQRAQLQLSVRGVGLAPLGRTLHLGSDKTLNHRVAPEFTDLYAAQGGDTFFGATLSEPLMENGILVQDFENARLVRDSDGVRLAELGSAILAIAPPDKGVQAAFRLYGTPSPAPEMRASVSVQSPTIGQGGQQTIFLVVNDGQGHPVSGAQALAVLSYNTGTAEVELPPSDDNGLASAAFIAPPAPSGSKVLIQMHVLIGETYLTAETSYFQWW